MTGTAEKSGDATKLAKLLKKLRARFAASLEAHVAGEGSPGKHAPLPALLACAECPAGEDPVVAQAVYSLLLWESSTPFARGAMRRMLSLVSDFNELRVASAEDIAECLGADDPRALERGMRLRAMLGEVSAAHPSLRVSALRERSRRDAKAFLQSLHAAPGFVAARLALAEFGLHAIPVDERLRTLLVDARVVAASMDVAGTAHWLEQSIPAEGGREASAVLQAWSDEDGTPPPVQDGAPGAGRRGESPARMRSGSAREGAKEGAKEEMRGKARTGVERAGEARARASSRVRGKASPTKHPRRESNPPQ